MKIFINNLSDLATIQHLYDLFLPYGQVISARIIGDAHGYSTCCGLIQMGVNAGSIAIRELDQKKFMNRYLEVREA